MSWLPPCAPHASACALMYVESIIKISPAGSPIAASASVFHIPLSRQRQNRLCMLFQFPNSGGISLHGAPVRRVVSRFKRRKQASQCCQFFRVDAPPGSAGSGIGEEDYFFKKIRVFNRNKTFCRGIRPFRIKIRSENCRLRQHSMFPKPPLPCIYAKLCAAHLSGCRLHSNIWCVRANRRRVHSKLFAGLRE